MLPEKDWLAKAKSLCVGMKDRVYHGSERRPNMVVGNEQDKWWAYCQACKEGGVVLKEHVILTALDGPSPAADLTFPPDLHMLAGSPEELPVLRFLASKNMDGMYLPPLRYSPSRKRLLLDTGYGWMGRDVTERSPQKWLTYNRQKLLGSVPKLEFPMTAVIVEDAFSWYKVSWAIRNLSEAPVRVLCALGTGIHDALVLELSKARNAVFFFDGDAAGYKGAAEGVKRMRAFNVPSAAVHPPEGLDPKDMQCKRIINVLENYYDPS